MPVDFYKVGPLNDRRFDDLGLRALGHDQAAWRGEPSEDLVMRSQFNLLYEIGVRLFGRRSDQAMDFAMFFFERRQDHARTFIRVNAQRSFGFNTGTI
jgi:hypothetical protein